MKPATHPKITVTGIIASAVINSAGFFLLMTTGHAGLMFVGMAVCFAVWIDIIVDHNRRLPPFLPDENSDPSDLAGTSAHLSDKDHQ